MKLWGFIGILLCLTFFSCEKENQIHAFKDIIQPKPYFPVYPKSWWQYEINDTTIFTSKVSDGYQLNAFRISQNADSGPVRFSDPAWVPFLDSKPIYGYEKIVHIPSPFGDYYRKWPILSETVGFTFERDWMDVRYGDVTEKVVVKDKVFNGIDSVLILEGHWVWGYESRKRYQVYTKNVGLTTDYIVDTLTMDTIFKKILLDYYVND